MADASLPFDVAPLIMQASRLQLDMMMARLHARGFGDFTCAFAAVMPLIDAQGVRASMIAQQAGVSKQAMSQLVRALEERRYVEKADDATDTRAKLIRLTARGTAVKQACTQVREELHAMVTAALGDIEVEALKARLAALIAALGAEASASPCMELAVAAMPECVLPA